MPVQGGTGNEGGSKPGSVSFGVGVADRYQARPRDPLGELHFPPEASTELVVGSLRRMDDLDGHALSRGIERGVHRAHTAGSKASYDAMGTYAARVGLLHRLNTAGHEFPPTEAVANRIDCRTRAQAVH
jgi:hypothetical protein